MKEDYNKEDDILYLTTGKGKTIHSRELKVDIVLDFDKNNDIRGIEIFDFLKSMEESQKKIDKIFKIKSKSKTTKTSKRNLTIIKPIKIKKIPVIIKFKRKDGTIAKIKATRYIVNSTKTSKRSSK